MTEPTPLPLQEATEPQPNAFELLARAIDVLEARQVLAELSIEAMLRQMVAVSPELGGPIAQELREHAEAVLDSQPTIDARRDGRMVEFLNRMLAAIGPK